MQPADGITSTQLLNSRTTFLTFYKRYGLETWKGAYEPSYDTGTTG